MVAAPFAVDAAVDVYVDVHAAVVDATAIDIVGVGIVVGGGVVDIAIISVGGGVVNIA